MKVMVLGGAGFVGSAVARSASLAGWTVAVVTRPGSDRWRWSDSDLRPEWLEADLCSPAALMRAVGAFAPEAIVQCVFPAGHGAERGEAAREFFVAGLQPALALDLALAAAGFKGVLVHTGSALVFDATSRPPQADDRPAPRSRRGLAKACTSLVYERAARACGFSFWNLHITSVYGPLQQPERLIPRLLRAGLGGPPVRMTERATLRNWIHVDDVAAACLAACLAPAPAPRQALVGHEVASNHEVAAKLSRRFGRSLVEGRWGGDLDAYEGAHLELDLEPTRQALGWSPRIDLETGLTSLSNWALTPAGRAAVERPA